MATTKLVTIEDLAGIENDIDRFEIIRGELIQMAPAGFEHSSIAAKILIRIGMYLQEHPAGEVTSEGAGFILSRNPDVLLCPDVSFTRHDRIPESASERKGFLAIAPDLVVEVISPSDRSSHVTDKVMTYLDAGVRLVWVVEPTRQVVMVYESDRTARVLDTSDEIDGGDVLPGFRLPVSEIFRKDAIPVQLNTM